MALLFPPGMRIATAGNVIVSGAKIRVRNANTSDLASLFSDADLTVPLPNPVICNSAGYPSTGAGVTPTLVFAEDANYDIAFLDASDVQLVAFEDLPSLGSDASTLLKVFGSARFQVDDDGGTIRIQAGDPSPDDTGGSMELSGWEGTQGVLLTFDFETVSTTGALTERGKKLPGIVQTAATQVTAVATPPIALPENIPGVRAWKVTLFDLQKSGSAGNIQAQLSYDGGGTYKSGASDYWSNIAYGGISTSAVADAFMQFTVGMEFPSDRPGLIEFLIITPDSGPNATVVMGQAAGFINGSASAEGATFCCYGVGGYERATHIQIYNSAAETLTFKYRVEPQYGFGEA